MIKLIAIIKKESCWKKYLVIVGGIKQNDDAYRSWDEKFSRKSRGSWFATYGVSIIKK